MIGDYFATVGRLKAGLKTLFENLIYRDLDYTVLNYCNDYAASLAFPSIFSKASSKLCLLVRTSLKSSPFVLTRSIIFAIVKSPMEIFLSSTSSQVSGAETVAPGT